MSRAAKPSTAIKAYVNPYKKQTRATNNTASLAEKFTVFFFGTFLVLLFAGSPSHAAEFIVPADGAKQISEFIVPAGAKASAQGILGPPGAIGAAFVAIYSATALGATPLKVRAAELAMWPGHFALTTRRVPTAQDGLPGRKMK